MNTFDLRVTLKTRLLNLGRRLFMSRRCEGLLARCTQGAPHGIVSRLVPPNYLYPAGSRRPVVRQGIRYDLDISHVVDHGVYFNLDDDQFRLIAEDLFSAALVLDVGANIGNSALRLAVLSPAARIHAFEPDPDTFQSALTNLRLNHPERITLHNCGLGDAVGRSKLYRVNRNNPGMNRILDDERDLPFRWIDVDALDRFAETHHLGRVNVIKIDVEGRELSVLKGARRILDHDKPVLHLELDDLNLRDCGTSARDVVAFLRACGYQALAHAITGRSLSERDDLDGCAFNIIARGR